jgi:hypothetical protein
MPSNNKKKSKTVVADTSSVDKKDAEDAHSENDTNFILTVLNKVATSSSTMTCVIILHLIAMHQMREYTATMQQFGAGIPDVMFAYKPTQLKQWINQIGDEGCLAYQKMAAWDLFPFMESYTLLLGGLLMQQAKLAKVTGKIALIFPFVMICDVIETVLPAKGCKDGYLSRVELSISAEANKFKWVGFMMGMIFLTALFIYNTFFPNKNVPADNKKDQ